MSEAATNFYKMTCLVAGLFHLALTIFVVSRDFRSKINRVYCLWGFALVLWNLSAFAKFQPGMEDHQKFWVRLVHLGLVFLPISIFHLCLLIAEVRRRKLLPILYAAHVALAGTVLFGDWYIGEALVTTPFGAAAKPGPAFLAYLVIYVGIAATTISLLYRRLKVLRGHQRTRLKALLLGYGLLVFFGTHDLIQLKLSSGQAGTYPLLGFQIYPLANLAAIFYGLVVAYSVLQHQLLDIHVAMGRMAAQAVRVLFMFLTGLLLLLLALPFDRSGGGLYPYLAALVVLLANSILATVLFPKLFGKGEEVFERRLLGDRFEFQDQIRGQIRRIRDCHEPTLLLASLQNLLVRSMGLRSYQIILLDETTRGFSLFDSYPMQTDTRLPWLSLESAVFRFFKNTHASYLTCRAVSALPGEREIERLARAELRQFNPEICFPLVSGDDPFGLLLLGTKESEEPFTPNDLQLIQDLVLNLRLVLDQIRLKNQIHLAQEQEMLGRMSRGLAHDLNNLLTPIQTSLQLVQAGVTSPETMDEILPMALRNVNSIRAYVNEALFFSRTHSLKLKRTDLNETVKATVGLLVAEAQRKHIRMAIDGAARADVEIDEVLIQRLLTNLLSNAIDATPAGGSIRIEVTPLPRTERNREWYRLRVQDAGSGISPENLKRVFMPYFSTKNTGDKRRGFGLGLAIARKIVHLHGGNMVIASEQSKGTTVQVDLPNRPPPDATKISEQLAVEFAT
jgi:signal transduction histidine kinase